ncbi:unnamed protein product [Effrenium voratum]|nr:unnamed protein product [Effrenium voratum]
MTSQALFSALILWLCHVGFAARPSQVLDEFGKEQLGDVDTAEGTYMSSMEVGQRFEVETDLGGWEPVTLRKRHPHFEVEFDNGEKLTVDTPDEISIRPLSGSKRGPSVGALAQIQKQPDPSGSRTEAPQETSDPEGRLQREVQRRKEAAQEDEDGETSEGESGEGESGEGEDTFEEEEVENEQAPIGISKPVNSTMVPAGEAEDVSESDAEEEDTLLPNLTLSLPNSTPTTREDLEDSKAVSTTAGAGNAALTSEAADSTGEDWEEDSEAVSTTAGAGNAALTSEAADSTGEDWEEDLEERAATAALAMIDAEHVIG